MSDKKNVVYYDAPATRPAPILETGLLGWVRNNLIKTPLDIFLSVVFGLVIVVAVVSFVMWTVRDANWWAIAFNLRQYTVSTYERELEWRLVLAVLVSVFVAGMGVAVWIKRLARILAGIILAVLIVMFLVPPIVNAMIALPNVYVMAGSAPVQAGNVNDVTRPYLSFVGKAGETITVQKTTIATDEVLANLAGFMDQPLSALRVVTQRRLQDIINKAALEDQLQANATSAIPLFTVNQATKKQADFDKLQPIPPVTESLNLNVASIQVELLDGVTLEPIGAPFNLPTADDLATFTLPKDGWYVLHTTSPDDPKGLAILSVKGMYPLLQASVLAVATDGGATSGFITNYERMTDNFVTSDVLPSVNGTVVPFFDIVKNQYWGSRPLDTYLRVYLAPFLEYHRANMTLVMLAGVVGYFLAFAIERIGGKQLVSSVTTYAFLGLLAFIWIMMTGLSIAEILNLSVVLGAVFFILFIRSVGAKYGRTPTGLAILLMGSVGVMVVPYLIFAPNYGIGILPTLNLFILVFAFLSWLVGTDSYNVSDNAEIDRSFGFYLVMTLTCLLIPLLLAQLGVNPYGNYPDWLLRPSDQRKWGGLMLTFMLTIYGIVASFPLGVLLALGRRSNLPIVKYGCTLYIELIRGAPFVTVLFLGQLMIPLINPAFADVPGTIRALIAVILFSAAYLAENIRGGLQSLPPGQNEAGRALGLSGWQIVYYVTMPQAIRAVIPALLGSFVSLFKDTSLVAIVGLIDLTGFVNVMVVQQAFSGTRSEGLLFVTIIYFVFSYAMSYVSKLLEASGSGAARRI